MSEYEIFTVLKKAHVHNRVDEPDTVETLRAQLKRAKRLKLDAQVIALETLIAEKKYFTIEAEVYENREDDIAFIDIDGKVITNVIKKGMFGSSIETLRNYIEKALWLIPIQRYAGRLPDSVFDIIAKKEFQTYHIGAYAILDKVKSLVTRSLRFDPVLFGFNGRIDQFSGGIVDDGIQKLYVLKLWGDDLKEIEIDFQIPEK